MDDKFFDDEEVIALARSIKCAICESEMFMTAIEIHRYKQGLTREELAKKSKVSLDVIENMEENCHCPSFYEILMILHALGYTLGIKPYKDNILDI